MHLISDCDDWLRSVFAVALNLEAVIVPALWEYHIFLFCLFLRCLFYRFNFIMSKCEMSVHTLLTMKEKTDQDILPHKDSLIK